uniref:Voltage-dependent T-type calcium channel subunit alpha n=1 Tax=Syphacia muris TaxID=451379 RepID=A0A0N5ALK3_9BILA
MFQEPVARDLRSFQSLSRFAGQRSALARRQSSIRSTSRRERGSTNWEVIPSPNKALRVRSKTLSLEGTHAYLWHDDTNNQEQRQVEWDTKEDVFKVDNNLPYPGFVEPALFCLHQTKPPRSWALELVMNPWFDRVTIIVILINCVTLGMYRPCEEALFCSSYRCQVLSLIDHVIFGYFFIEMVIIALGFYGSSAYLSDTWNRLDFFIVCSGIAEYALQRYVGNLNLTAIRTIRVLRPLRAVNRIPSMRILVNLLLDTLPMLGNVLLLCFFVFFIFGIVGVQMWAGVLRHRCTYPENQREYFIQFNLTYYKPEDTSLEYICSPPDMSGLHSCNNLPPHRENGVDCSLTIEDANKISETSCINWNQYYNVCRVVAKNPFDGAVSFDNIGYAWVAIFLVISLEGWTDIMYYVQDAHSFWNWIYFVLLIVIGAFFMINLCLVVIATQFAETKRRETERMLEERKRLLHSSMSLSEGTPSSKEGAAGDSVYGAIVRLLRHHFRRVKRRLKRHVSIVAVKRPSKWSQIREKLQSFVSSKYFTRGILCAILVNTMSMGIEHHQQPETLTTILEWFNHFFTLLFLAEMVLKIAANGLFTYLADGFNVFDGGIVVMSVLELLQGGRGGLAVLRTFRLLRVLKIVRFLPALRYQLLVMLRTMDNVTVFVGLLMLFIFIFSILGMNLFGCKFCDEIRVNGVVTRYKCKRKNFATLLWALVTVVLGMVLFGCKFCWYSNSKIQCPAVHAIDPTMDCDCDRTNFNTFLHATVTVFEILTQEDWNMVLFNGMAHTNPWASLYFVLLMTFGNYVLFNLLVAILVEGFQESKEDEKRQQEEEQKLKNEEEAAKEKKQVEEIVERNMSSPFLTSRKVYKSIIFIKKVLLNRHTSLYTPKISRRSNCGLQRVNSFCGLQTVFNPYCQIHGCRALATNRAVEEIIKFWLKIYWKKLTKGTFIDKRSDYALFLLSPENPVRIFCLRLTQKKWFDYFILCIIAINCITLAMERPSIPPDSPERLFLTISGYVFTVIFTIEMSLKVTANGFFSGKGAYFKDGWNVLDGTLVIISLMNAAIELLAHSDSPKIFGVVRVLRLLRALRPLRVINRAPGVKLVVMTLISSIKPIGNIVLICCTFFVIFGILGVQLFKGMMYFCVGPEISNVTTKSDCLADPRNKWMNQRYNFDNIGHALMSLFVLSSKDGWVSIMYQGIDAVGVDMQPIENYNEWRMIYFISFLLLVGFFVLNMFVGVVVENFHKCKEALEAELKEHAKQKRLQRKLEMQKYESLFAVKKKKRYNVPYWTSYGKRRLLVHSIITSKYFDLAIAAVIGVNVISMAMEFYMMPNGLKYTLKTLNYFFTSIFTLEAALKIYALGFQRFMRERWNQLDILIVILSIAGIVFEEFEALELPINPTIIRVMRVLRIARVLKLLKMAKGIRSLLDTVGEALPQVGNLGSLFFLLFFIFAALGVELFGKLECSDEHPCDGLGEHAHFKNFGMAFLTLFRIATGDNWNGIMKDALRDDCDASDHCETNCCVDKVLAPLYFIIFVLISQFVLVNVVVAVLMKHLEESNKRRKTFSESGAESETQKTESDEDGMLTL